ncbi:MAG: hypothetical protein IJX66_03725 [Lachnospiraceae bacterium]|nr:hypothetical protein [Lachnospiraceae bacterium]
MEHDREELEFCEEWLTLKKYYFKILTMVTVLADNQKAFRGKIKDLCHSLDIQSSSANIQKIRESINFLAENDYIKVIVDNNIYTISLAHAAEKSKKVIKIKKTWYKLIRESEGTASWENTLKVFLVITELAAGDVIKYTEIAEKTGIKNRTVQSCVKTITSIDFEDFRISKRNPHSKKCGRHLYYRRTKFYKGDIL